MNIRELLNQLEECNEEATVSCVVKPNIDEPSYLAKVLRTNKEENYIEILVKNLYDDGMTMTLL